MKLLTTIGLLAVFLGGCSAAPAGVPGGGQPPPAAPGTPDGGEPANPDDPLGFGEEANTAVVTIGDQRYEFGNLRCFTVGGAIGAQSRDGDPRVDIDLPPLDWETSGDDWSPPGIRVIVEGVGTWIANPEHTALPRIEPGLSQVDSYETDGFRATGTATFMDANGWQAAQFGLEDQPPDPVQGTFGVACPAR
jgi:hypothetical protein